MVEAKGATAGQTPTEPPNCGDSILQAANLVLNAFCLLNAISPTLHGRRREAVEEAMRHTALAFRELVAAFPVRRPGPSLAGGQAGGLTGPSQAGRRRAGEPDLPR
jgi:hypothetical protein